MSSARARTVTAVPIKVAGLTQGEEAYVTLAAVDEAVLKLTDFASPSPADYFYGKRKLGVELRDLYGRLIDPHANAVGALRSGGDQFAKLALGRRAARQEQPSGRAIAQGHRQASTATAPRFGQRSSTCPTSRASCG